MPSGHPTPTIPRPTDQASRPPRTWVGSLFQRRLCVVPTWRGWLVVLLVLTLSVTLVMRRLCVLLTVNDPLPGGILVVEGWMPSYALRAAIDEFHRHPYRGIYVTGGPVEEGSPYFGYQSYAEFTAEKLRDMGAPSGSLHAVPIPYVPKDRTYNMADALKAELKREGISSNKITIMSLGPHSRRSQFLYRLAFGSQWQIGTIGVTQIEYDPDHWWKTSDGFRTVIGEFIAYAYARLAFRAG